MAKPPKLANAPAGSTIAKRADGSEWIKYPKPVEVTWVFTPRPDPRDARLAELTTALRHIRTLASDAPSLAMNMTDGDIFDTIALLAADALIGAMPEPECSMERVYEELAI